MKQITIDPKLIKALLVYFDLKEDVLEDPEALQAMVNNALEIQLFDILNGKW